MRLYLSPEVMRAHTPLAYPLALTATALLGCAAWLPVAGPDQRAALATVILLVVVYTGWRIGYAVRARDWAASEVRSVRQEQGLFARRWIELHHHGTVRWIPVYFNPALAALPSPSPDLLGLRPFPAGRVRTAEPPGRLVDSPAVAIPDRVQDAARWRRRLLLDGQPAVAAPFAALLWVYIAGGGPAAFAAATVTSASVIVWLWAIRGSDPT